MDQILLGLLVLGAISAVLGPDLVSYWIAPAVIPDGPNDDHGPDADGPNDVGLDMDLPDPG